MKKSSTTRALLILLALLLILPPIPALATPIEEATELQNAPNVTAQTAIVICVETGDVLFARNPDTRRPPASMTKIMTAFIVYEEIAAGRLTLDTMVYISHHAANFALHSWPGHIRLPAGSYQSVETLLRLIILPSHNGACVAIAEHISGSEAAFMYRVREVVERLGMDAVYENSHGLWGNSKSARATAILTQTFIQTHPDILRITNMRFFTFNGVPANNTGHQIIAHPHIDGVKQGTTAAAGWNYSGTAFRGNNRVVSVTMNSSSSQNRYTDSFRLLNFGLDELDRRDRLMYDISVDNITANVSAARRNTDITFTAHLGNVNTGGFTAHGGGWIINGEIVSTFGRFAPAYQRTLSLSYFLPAHSNLQTLDVEFFIDLPGDIRRFNSLTLPVSNQAPALFRDIDGHWAYADINQAVTRELFSGTGGGFFNPNGNMTRAMFVTVLGRAARQMGIPVYSLRDAPFTDVSWNGWYTDYVSWAWEQGFVQGIGGNLFGTNRPVTRQEVATLFYRFMEHYNLHLPGNTFTRFPDEDQIANWAYDAIREAVRIGLITGFADGRLAPTYTASRAQLAAIFLRFLNSAGGGIHFQYEYADYNEWIEEDYSPLEDHADDLT